MSFILSLLSLEAAGIFFMLLVVKRGRHDFSVPELLSLSFFLGMGFISYQCLLFDVLGIGYALSNLVIVPVLLFILAFARYASKPERVNEFLPGRKALKGWSLTERLLWAGILAQLLWTVFLVLPVPVNSHDAVANYALKAKMFYLEGGIPEGFFTWPESTVAHPDYPLLVPFLMTWIYAFTGLNDLVVNMVMPVIYLGFLGLFYSQIRKFFTRSYSLLMVFLLATIPQLADYATIIHADLILAALVTCAFIYFVLYIRKNDRAYLIFSSLLFGISLWAKNEALVFVGAFAAVLAAFAFRSATLRGKRKTQDIIISLLLIAILALPWFAVKISSGVSNSDIDISMLTTARLWQNVKDIPVMLNLFQQEVFGPKKWNIFWVIVFASMIWKRKMLLKGDCFYITLFLVLSAAGYFAGYMATTGNNLYFYVNTTISRFMLHFCGIALFLVAFLLWDEIRGIKSFSAAEDRDIE